MSATSNWSDQMFSLETPAGLPEFAAFATRGIDDRSAAVAAAEAELLHSAAVPARHETFRLGRAAAHAALQSIGRDEGPILAGANREPIWPTGVSGSISHIAGLGVALVAPAAQTDGVGIDIELHRRAPELERQVPRPEERAWLDQLAPEDRSQWLLALFSAKESIFKAFFPRVGAFFGFEAASLAPAPSGFTGRLVADIDSSYGEQRAFDIGCVRGETLVMTWLVLPTTG